MNQVNSFSKNNKKVLKRGFTLVEMLVSIAIFSIVLVVIMGTIITIVDTNRKARTLTEVMNNLNFALESMTRTLKTATTINVNPSTGDIIATDQYGRDVYYSYQDSSDADSDPDTIYKQIEDGDPVAITSSDVKIENFQAYLLTTELQPRIFFSVRGKVETTRGITSEFNVQSTVSQRQLELN